MRVIVVGSGIAGLVAAYHASRRHEVVLVTKADLAESNTRYAQGGIAAVLFDDDDVAMHVADTLAAGAGLCDADAVEVLCSEGPERVRDLLRLGVELDRVAGPGSPLARGREAAHSAARILHGGGDQTGLAIEIGLVHAVRRTAVEIHEHTVLQDLLLAPGIDGLPHVTGITAVGPQGEPLVIHADAVVLATGGAGRLYPHTTNPEVATADGVGAALRAGAVVQDLEMYQFHPTALAVPGTPLVSEAVRGEGAVLLDETGRRFMLDLHPDGELAPRDVVARGIASAMARQEGRPVLLDAARLGADRLRRRFPSITRTVLGHGLDWTTSPVPVTPAAHYSMGGIATDAWGRTSVRALWAVGEAACTGVHGANRLASNSLLEGLVFAFRAVRAIDAADAEGTTVDTTWPDWPNARPLPQPAPSAARTASPSASRTDPPSGARTPTPSSCAEGALRLAGARAAQAPRPQSQDLDRSPAFSREALQLLLWQHVGLERDAAGLAEAAATVAAWRAAAPSTLPATAAAIEDRNLLDVARAMITAAQARTESRGAHSRRDFWDTDPAQARSTAWRETSSVPLTHSVTTVGATA